MTIAKNVSYDPHNVLPCDYIGATDPALDAANGVQAGKTWAEADEDPPTDFTEIVGYWIRNLANDTWIALTVTGAPPTGAAGGSLGGTYPNPSIATSASLPGSPTTTTQSPGDNSTKIATTAYADASAAAAAAALVDSSPSALDTLNELAAALGDDANFASTMTTALAAKIAKSLIDAKGDLIAGTADDTPARLAVGINGQRLVADSTATPGVKWAGTATVSKSGNYTAAAGDEVILCDASGGAFTITLPAVASSTGMLLNIKKTDSSGNAVTIDGNASETIDGATTVAISVQYQSYTIVCNGSAWFIL